MMSSGHMINLCGQDQSIQFRKTENYRPVREDQGLMEVWVSVLEAPLGLDVVEDLLQLFVFKPTLQTGDQGFGLLSSFRTQVS